MTTTTPTPALADLDLDKLEELARAAQLAALRPGIQKQAKDYFGLVHAMTPDAVLQLIALARRAAQPVAPVHLALPKDAHEAVTHWNLLPDAKPISAPSPQIAEVAELPPLPEGEEAGMMTGSSIVYTAEQYRQGQRDAIAASRRAKRPMSPEIQAAIAEAHKTGATSALASTGEAVFINYGHDYGDSAHLECTACGGSGHIEDQKLRATPAPASAGQAAPMQSAAKKHRAQIAEVVHGTSLPPLERGELTLAIADLLDDALAAHPTEDAGQAAPAEQALRRLCDQLSGMQRRLRPTPGTGQNHSYLMHEDVEAYVEEARKSLAAQPAEGAGQAGQVAKGKRLSESAVRQLALSHASAASGGEHYEFDQQGMDAFAIDIMDAMTERAAAPADLEQQLIERRIGLTPENEGGWHAQVYRDSETPLAKGYGATPSEAIRSATHQPSVQKGGEA